MLALTSPSVERARPEALAPALALLEAVWRDSPVLPLPGIAAERQLRLYLSRAAATLSHPAATVFSARDGDGLAGVASWSPLEWDSRMYGFPAARLDLVSAADPERLPSLVDAVLCSARERGIRHLIARVDASELALAEALCRAGFSLIDGIQTFALPLPASAPPPPGVATRLFEPPDLEQVLALARTAYRLDRFHADAALDGQTADRINEEWLRNSCAGRAADSVWVAVSGPEVLGYVTCKMDHAARSSLGVPLGTIVMVATTAQSRRQGVAAACTQAAVAWFGEQGAALVQVGTQLRNIAAARLYERCGFRLAANSLTWRILL